jgi:hypothetical protein
LESSSVLLSKNVFPGEPGGLSAAGGSQFFTLHPGQVRVKRLALIIKLNRPLCSRRGGRQEERSGNLLESSSVLLCKNVFPGEPGGLSAAGGSQFFTLHPGQVRVNRMVLINSKAPQTSIPAEQGKFARD